jgi:hypothetical protein
MKAWGKKVGWDLTRPLRNSPDKPGAKEMSFWIDRGEKDYKQLAVLLFRRNKLVSVSLAVTGKMDTAIQAMLKEECSPLEPDLWNCSTSKTGAQRHTSPSDVGVVYTFVDASSISQ